MCCVNGYCDKISTPPPLTNDSQTGSFNISPLQNYLEELYRNIHSPQVVTTAPNNSQRGREGQLVFYLTGGTYELWVKTNVDDTDWQKIGP